MKLFRDAPASLDQMFLLPLSVDQFVAKDSPARVLAEIIASLDSSKLYAKYIGGGAPAYDPVMMLRVLVFAYAEGIRSSRKIAKALEQDVRFMFLAEMNKPKFRTIARFREENLEAMSELFVETVKTSKELGLVLLDHISVDGTKIEANVSREQTYRKDRLDKAIDGVENRIAQILKEASETDASEDAQYGDKRGDELPEGLRDAQVRKRRLEAAREKLEETGRTSIGTTDLDSRVMKTRHGNKAAYNGQAAVDKGSQIIVAAKVVQDENDFGQLNKMIDQVETNTGKKPKTVSADGGYYTSDEVKTIEDRGIDAYMPDGSKKDDKKPELSFDEENDEYICLIGKHLKFSTQREIKGLVYRVYRCNGCKGCPLVAECKPGKKPTKELYVRVGGEADSRMRAKMASKEGKSIYRLRKQIIEPVFGNIKWNMGMSRLLLRGLRGASIEYYLACACHNIGKIMHVWSIKSLKMAC
jgi:transposase